MTYVEEDGPVRRRHVGFFGSIIGLVVQFIGGAIVLILGMAFILKLLGANASSQFVDWIYARAADLMEPFQGVFGTIDLGGDSRVQLGLLFALFVYAVIGALILSLVRRLDV